MWFGTANGLSSYDRLTKKFKTYREENGLPHNQIASIVEDDNGILWLSSEKGLTSFNYKTGIFNNYTKKDGLKDLEFTARAAAKGKDGKIYFGGKSGVVYFDQRILLIEHQMHR
jgi:ligand-binding sensor domain-containing protein